MRANASPELKALREISNKQVDNMIIPIVNTKCGNLSDNDKGRVIFMLGQVLQREKTEHSLTKIAAKKITDKLDKLSGKIMADTEKYPELIPFLD